LCGDDTTRLTGIQGWDLATPTVSGTTDSADQSPVGGRYAEAFEAALSGQIVHSGSVTALSRAARALKLI